eukprot:TRINITY_DN41403_c0_g1_i1.p1 TRINITY_DN41403_c0_g1~~TRINITY_DN41403_c0_g1_i1.p1  ORF type:complete len:300 (+),score=56.44 TRINITY_DN41403_c0_g1_i1:84-983(+)
MAMSVASQTPRYVSTSLAPVKMGAIRDATAQVWQQWPTLLLDAGSAGACAQSLRLAKRQLKTPLHTISPGLMTAPLRATPPNPAPAPPPGLATLSFESPSESLPSPPAHPPSTPGIGLSPGLPLPHAQAQEQGKVPPPLGMAPLTMQMDDQKEDLRIEWKICGKKLSSKDQKLVSPTFKIEVSGRRLSCRITVLAKEITKSRGGASFKMSHGCGSIMLKCEPEDQDGAAQVDFKIGAGAQQSPTMSHDFMRQSCWRNEALETCDFKSCVDHSSKFFTIHLEILHGKACCDSAGVHELRQ